MVVAKSRTPSLSTSLWDTRGPTSSALRRRIPFGQPREALAPRIRHSLSAWRQLRSATMSRRMVRPVAFGGRALQPSWVVGGSCARSSWLHCRLRTRALSMGRGCAVAVLNLPAGKTDPQGMGGGKKRQHQCACPSALCPVKALRVLQQPRGEVSLRGQGLWLRAVHVSIAAKCRWFEPCGT